MSIPKRVRYEVMRRDNFTCRYCRSADNPLTIDHVVPVVLGGSDHPSNLVAACRDCNAGKTSATPDEQTVEDVTESSLRFARAWYRAGDILAESRESEMEYMLGFKGLVEKYSLGMPVERWGTSAVQFYKADVELEEVEYALFQATIQSRIKSQDRFRYACGIIWKRARARTDFAASMFAEENPA